MWLRCLYRMARCKEALLTCEQVVRELKDADEDDARKARQRADERVAVSKDRAPPRSRGVCFYMFVTRCLTELIRFSVSAAITTTCVVCVCVGFPVEIVELSCTVECIRISCKLLARVWRDVFVLVERSLHILVVIPILLW